MMAEDDFWRVVREDLHDRGVYVVDKDKMIIYYLGKDSSKFHDIGPLAFVRNDGPGNASVPLTAPAYESSSVGSGAPVTPADKDSERSTMNPLFSSIGDPTLTLTKISSVRNSEGDILGAVQHIAGNQEICRIRRRLEELEEAVLLDPLTGVGNRRYAEIYVKRCLDEMSRYGWPFGVLFIDVDHFKDINDTFGHGAGDRALRMITSALGTGLRSSDLVARWGGDEFVVVVKNVGNPQILCISEKVRGLIEQCRVATDCGFLGITVSVGATLAGGCDSMASLIHRADSLMYQSKEAGRNRVSTDV